MKITTASLLLYMIINESSKLQSTPSNNVKNKGAKSTLCRVYVNKGAFSACRSEGESLSTMS